MLYEGQGTSECLCGVALASEAGNRREETTVAAMPSIVIKKTFTYRSSVKVFTNRYHFSGGLPATQADWDTFADAVVAAEKACYLNSVEIVEAVGYAAGSDLPVYTKTYAVPGTATFTGSSHTPGEVCCLVRYTTDARTTKNHPIYLFNYYHGAVVDNSGDHDEPFPAQKTALTGYAGDWVSGFSDGTNTYHRAGPNGAVALTGACETFLSHRDFRN
jgi:hypothetical protein